jgi:hypothetical protein
MRLLSLVILIIGIAGITTGCNGEKPVDKTKAKEKPLHKTQAKLDAALAIGDPAQRDASLASVAESAAVAAEPDIVKQALKNIGDPARRDHSAEAAALKLMNTDQAAGAVGVANMIGDPSLRDRTLSKLAK